MAHDLFRDTMAFVGAMPWHKLGRKVPAGTSAADFIKAAGLDWEVEAVPAPGAKRRRNGGWDRVLLQRHAVGNEAGPVVLALVTHRYVPLQNADAFRFFDPLLRNGWAQLETAGALGDGETVWVQVRLRDDIDLGKGDVIRRYLLLRNRHDGEGAVSVRFTPVRVVCQNTLTFAERRNAAFATVRHVGSLLAKLEDVQADALQEEVEQFSERTRKIFVAMVDFELPAQVRLALLGKLCGPVPDRDPRRHDPPTRREMVEQRLKDQRNVDPTAPADTAWGLYNAITWVEDERARRRSDTEDAVNAMWFGSGANNKARAFDEIAKIVGADMARPA